MFAMILAASVALQCQLNAMDDHPPMLVTLNEGASTVQVSMAGQTYLEDTVLDGPIVWWQVHSIDGATIRSRLNRADGTIIIANENVQTNTHGPLIKGHCKVAEKKF